MRQDEEKVRPRLEVREQSIPDRSAANRASQLVVVIVPLEFWEDRVGNLDLSMEKV